MVLIFFWSCFIAGSIGITLSVGWSEPLDPFNPDDIEASERDLSFGHGWFAHPIYVNGDYPEIMKWKIGNKSMEQGFNESRLPVFTDDEKRLVNGMSFILRFNAQVNFCFIYDHL